MATWRIRTEKRSAEHKIKENRIHVLKQNAGAGRPNAPNHIVEPMSAEKSFHLNAEARPRHFVLPRIPEAPNGGLVGWLERRIGGSSNTPRYVEVLRPLHEELGISSDALRSLSRGFEAVKVPADKESRPPLTPPSRVAMKILVAGNQNTPAEVILKLSRDRDRIVRIETAHNPSAPTHLLETFSRDADYLTRSAVASNSASPDDALTRLSTDQWMEVRAAVAANPSTPRAVLDRLSRDPNPTVRIAVVKNASTPAETRNGLGMDLSPAVLRSLERSPLVAGSVLARVTSELSKTPSDEWITTSSNPWTPSQVLQQMIDGSAAFGNSNWGAFTVFENVAENPAAHSGTLAKLSLNEASAIRRAVANNPSTSESVLALLAADPEETVRKEAEKNLAGRGVLIASGRSALDNAADSSTSPDVLRILGESASMIFRGLVAANPSTPADVLAKLGRDKSLWVNEQVARNRSTPADVLAAMKKNIKWPSTQTEIARNTSASAETLASLARSDFFNVRLAVAANPSTPTEVLTTLSKEPSERLRQTAKQNALARAKTTQTQ